MSARDGRDGAATTGRTKWAEVDLGILRANAAALRALAGDGCAVMAMVKANGYGHGAVDAAASALAGGATWLGVSSIVEAVELRRAGIDAPVLNCGWTTPAEMRVALDKGIDVAVFTPADVAAALEASAGGGRRVRAHWKIDTGMGRLGTRPDGLDVMAEALSAARAGLEVVGMFTHFASADAESLEDTRLAHTRFLEAVERFGDRFGSVLLHCANSAAALRMPETRHHLIRPGIVLYGYPPPRCDGVVAVRPAMRVCALVTQVKPVVAGDRVGYGGEWVAQRLALVATIAAGYADGVDRRNGNRGAVIAGGALCPIIGRISMDQLSIDVSHAGPVRAGDQVVLLGDEAGLRVDAATIAESIGTISYEVLCSVSSRVPRVAIDGGRLR